MEGYELVGMLGQGAYGVVSKAIHRQSGNCVALKHMALESHEASEVGIPANLIREVSILKHMPVDPNLVRLFDVFRANNALVLVFECCETDLGKYISNNHPIPIPTIKRLMFQLLRGLTICHKWKIIHRDLKPENLLLLSDGTLKIADFGISRTVSNSTNPYNARVVTMPYRAPELLFGFVDYTELVDVWSSGCIFAEMVTGKALFHGGRSAKESDQLNLIFRLLGVPSVGEWPELSSVGWTPPEYRPLIPAGSLNLFERLDESGRDLLSAMLQCNPRQRISAEQAMSHEFFAEVAHAFPLLPIEQIN
eukprot:c19391_g1_i2.p1 GENE.c19391_g1_i2~~c19391_g1_i2.p1  ORF type:complete len:308 (-),score=36.83 c19391_g1_i2:24-947(-)